MLPLGRGVLLDPFAGSGSTLAAAQALGYECVGLERYTEYFELANNAILRLAELPVGLQQKLYTNKLIYSISE